jgi:hypothetical protein
MTPEMLAGHSMVSNTHGEACEVCGKTWLQMLGERPFWKVGAMGIAHTAGLNDAELAQLNARIARTWSSVKAAVEA